MTFTGMSFQDVHWLTLLPQVPETDTPTATPSYDQMGLSWVSVKTLSTTHFLWSEKKYWVWLSITTYKFIIMWYDLITEDVLKHISNTTSYTEYDGNNY